MEESQTLPGKKVCSALVFTISRVGFAVDHSEVCQLLVYANSMHTCLVCVLCSCGLCISVVDLGTT